MRRIFGIRKILKLYFAITNCNYFNSGLLLFFGLFIIAFDIHFCSHLTFDCLVQFL